jgi:hypothetical protein
LKQDIDDQLKELNSHSQDNIEWEIRGEKPKNIKVSRLLKSSFNDKLNFESIRRIYDSMIDIEFLLEYENGNY